MQFLLCFLVFLKSKSPPIILIGHDQVYLSFVHPSVRLLSCLGIVQVDPITCHEGTGGCRSIAVLYA